MGLAVDQNTPGLWIGDQWREGTSGLFAVVVGVSGYDHLDGGDSPAPETYGLGQLSVSALTAYRMFEWLSDAYTLEGCPVAHVWMLLAPTQKEKAFEPALEHHRLAPTIDNCEHAIGQWQAAMQALPQGAAEGSRALFFFSGHGLEVHQNRQILLPADYLSPPARNLNNALSTENLINGLASLKVTRQFFFLDACRNDNQKLREKLIQGRKVLNEDVSALVNPDVIAPILYATASGQQAFQQPEPHAGLSLFGTALLDGLAGKPDIELKRTNGHWSVNVYPLQGYVKSRIIKLLEQAKERVRQPVKLGGTSDNEIVTLVPKPRRAVVISPTAPPLSVQRAMRVEKALGATFSVSRKPPKRAQAGGWSQDDEVGHKAFGSESATGLWGNLRLIALTSGVEKGAGEVVLHQVSRAKDTRRFQVEISPIGSDPLGHWLELFDSKCRFGALLPSDRSETLRYIVEFDLEFREEDPDAVRRISRLQVTLSPTLSGSAGIAAKLWETYNASDAGTATQVIQDQKLAERLLAKKIESPLAAAIASLVLLRANRLDLLHDWVRNVANWFPHLPDGATLWAEQTLRQSKKADAIREAAAYTSQLTGRGLPLMTETVAYAARHLELLVQRTDVLDADLLGRLAHLRERMAQVLVYFRTDGLFSVFTGYDERSQVLEPLGLGAIRLGTTPSISSYEASP
ncbi:MAG: caspase family protein [Nitrospiraceae bacterium]